MAGDPSRAVLFVAADLPWPADGGGRIASLRVLEAFARSHAVDLVALADPARPVDVGPLEDLCRRVEVVPHPFTFGLHPVIQTAVAMRSLVSGDPYRFRKFRSRALAAAIERSLQAGAYAVAHCEQLGVAQYRVARLPSTATTQNVESQIYETARHTGTLASRAWAAVEAAKLRRREARSLAAFGHVFVLSDDDGDALRDAGVRRVSTLPIPAPPVTPRRRPPGRPTILTLGSMSWFGVAEGLRWFHESVWPRILAEVPDAEWFLVGSGAPRDIRAWTGQPGLRVLGHVADLDDVLDRTRVAVVPLRIAGGIRIKLLELMSAGVPTVTTERGARGIPFPDGAGCLRRDDPASFAEAVLALLRDDEHWLETADRGRAYISTRHAPAALDAALARGLDEAIEHHRRSTARSQTEPR